MPKNVVVDDDAGGDSPPVVIKAFDELEKVLAYHGNRIYEAKIQRSELRMNEWKYYLHYIGWNKYWDEWVGEERLLKHTEENLMKQNVLDQKQGLDNTSRTRKPPSQAQLKAKAKAKAKAAKAKGSTDSKGKKPKSDTEQSGHSVEKLVKIQIPSTLKKQLIDDWDSIIVQDKLVKLPCAPNVDEILTKYLEYRSKKDGMVSDSIGQIFRGIKCYFDKAMPVMLLYGVERMQFKNAIVDDVSPSTIYGAEHLLRLFVKLPELLSHANIDEETLIPLRQKLLDFLKYLQKNQGTFFLSEYDDNPNLLGESSGKDE